MAQTFNDQFRAWAASDGADEMAAGAEEDRAFRAESGLEWHPYELELDCSLYQTEELISVQAEYYSYTGGAHPNTVLLAWNYDLTTGQFLTPEQLAADGQAFPRRSGRNSSARARRRLRTMTWRRKSISGPTTRRSSPDGAAMPSPLTRRG